LPFGQLISGGERYGFTGKEFNPDTELNYFGARYYDPNSGRFLTIDPLLQYASPYIYCGNSPLNCVDPSGMKGERPKKFSLKGLFEHLMHFEDAGPIMRPLTDKELAARQREKRKKERIELWLRNLKYYDQRHYPGYGEFREEPTLEEIVRTARDTGRGEMVAGFVAATGNTVLLDILLEGMFSSGGDSDEGSDSRNTPFGYEARDTPTPGIYGYRKLVLNDEMLDKVKEGLDRGILEPRHGMSYTFWFFHLSTAENFEPKLKVEVPDGKEYIIAGLVTNPISSFLSYISFRAKGAAELQNPVIMDVENNEIIYGESEQKENDLKE